MPLLRDAVLRNRRSTRKSIARRWMVNGLGLVFAILLIVELFFIFAIRFYTYSGVRNALFTRANAQSLLIERFMLTTNFEFDARARELVEGFTDKEKMEMQILDASGRILFSSSGFAPRETGPPQDFVAATTSEDGSGVWQGENSSGEPVMALSVLIVDKSDNIVGAVRYVVSLSLVNQQIMISVSVLLLVGILIFIFMMLSSSYFVSTIINPITEIGRAARQIALGDYHSRLNKKYDDEIGDLCDTINYMAEELSAAEQMKNDFISSVSHELRTPLTAIKGWSETLREAGPGDGELIKKGLDVIAGEAERLSGIVEELLDFSRMQSGRMEMRFERMDVLAELEEAVVLYREKAERDGIELQYVENDNLPPILGDRDRLKQVFINILDNALKYSGPGGKVRVEAAVVGRHIQVVISDNGEGISNADLPYVKEKFYRANRTRPGSGIGLALADEIVSRHKGYLDIDSEQGVGTTVTITLPTADSGLLSAQT